MLFWTIRRTSMPHSRTWFAFFLASGQSNGVPRALQKSGSQLLCIGNVVVGKAIAFAGSADAPLPAGSAGAWAGEAVGGDVEVEEDMV